MPGTRWQWWLVAGLGLALLNVAPLAAQSLAPSVQVVGAVCPLSDDQTQRATTAFEQLAHTFTTEPRCVNCHGGVNPFASDGGNHVGGALKLIFQPVPVLDKALIALGIKTSTEVVDQQATNDQCQQCHSGLPGWKLPPADDGFKGKTAVAICKNQKVVFGKLLNTGPPGFAGHIEKDVKDVPFIANAFLGNRGLNLFALENFVPDFKLEPPTNVTHQQLNALAGQWAAALGSKFQGDEECGCAQHHYALFLEETTADRDPTNPKFIFNYTLHGSGQAQVPITFKADGSFTGSGDEQRIIYPTVTVQPAYAPSCTWTPAAQTVSWSLSGSVEGSDTNTPGVMHIKLSWVASDFTTTATCQGHSRSVATYTTNGTDSEMDVSTPDIPALVGETRSWTKPQTGLYQKKDFKLTIRQVD